MNNFKAEHKELRQRDTFAPPPLRVILLAGLSLFLVGVLVFGNFLLFDKLLLYKDIGDDSINGSYPYFVISPITFGVRAFLRGLSASAWAKVSSISRVA